MKVIDRFLKYVSFWTTSEEHSNTVPSTDRQLVLARYLAKELTELGLSDVRLDGYGYVYGQLPATKGYEDCPSIGFLAHMDTSPESSGKNIKPQIIKNYDGEDIVLGTSGNTIKVQEFPHLKDWKGRTIITTDGTTLLGADDKAGIAEIMTAVEEIMESGEPHGKICVGFTIDEEIGNGAEQFSLVQFGAKYAYTMDGGIEGEIQYENFNAANAIVKIKGTNIHPGSAKDIMVNSQYIAMEIQQMLPPAERPEYTQGYEGFFHLIDMRGNVEESQLSYIIRDFDEGLFKRKKDLLASICKLMNEKYGNRVELILEDSYYNMKHQLASCMFMIDYAINACIQAEITPLVVPIRGGTDGARLSFRGLPCPNLGTGGEAFHGVYEHISVEGMLKSVNMIKNLVALYAKKHKDGR